MYEVESQVKNWIILSLVNRLEGWDAIDNIHSNNELIQQWVTDIMALGFNGGNVEDAANDIADLQPGKSIEDIRARVLLSFNRFGEEVAAFQSYVECRDEDDDETIIKKVREELEGVELGDFIIA